MQKFNSATAWIRTPNPCVIGSKPDALMSDKKSILDTFWEIWHIQIKIKRPTYDNSNKMVHFTQIKKTASTL